MLKFRMLPALRFKVPGAAAEPIVKVLTVPPLTWGVSRPPLCTVTPVIPAPAMEPEPPSVALLATVRLPVPARTP